MTASADAPRRGQLARPSWLTRVELLGNRGSCRARPGSRTRDRSPEAPQPRTFRSILTSRRRRLGRCWRVVAACGRLLSGAVERAGPETVAWHWGISDAAGFAAMGVAERLSTLTTSRRDLAWAGDLRSPLSQLVVDRLLPIAPQARVHVLLWATGRADLEGRPRVSEWVWRAALRVTADLPSTCR